MRDHCLLHLPIFSLAALLPIAAAAHCLGAEPGQTNRFSISTGPVLQCPTDTSVRVTWMTDRNATGTVEYGPVNGELSTARSAHHGLIDTNERLHSVVLAGLRPGTRYRYRVVSRDILRFEAYKVDFGDTASSDFREFTALDCGKVDFSFLVLNDVHDRAATIPEMLQAAGPGPYDLVILNGDVVSHTDNENPVISILNQAAASFASTTPMVWVRGNHEIRGRFARQLAAYVGLPEGRYYYAFSHGPVRFIVLDAGEDKIDRSPEYSGLVDFSSYRREQGAWLREEVRSDAFQHATYHVVFCHMPFPSKRAAEPMRASGNNVFLGMAEAFAEFGQTLESAGVDVMISGHTHSAALIPNEPGRHSYPILQGGSDKAQGRTVMRIHVTRDALNGAILRPDGSLFASCRITPNRR